MEKPEDEDDEDEDGDDDDDDDSEEEVKPKKGAKKISVDKSGGDSKKEECK